MTPVDHVPNLQIGTEDLGHLLSTLVPHLRHLTLSRQPFHLTSGKVSPPPLHLPVSNLKTSTSCCRVDEVFTLVAIWGKEKMQATPDVSHRNLDYFESIVQKMVK